MKAESAELKIGIEKTCHGAQLTPGIIVQVDEGTESGMKSVTNPHPRKVTITGSNPYILVEDRHSVQDGRYDKGRVVVDWDIWPCLSNLGSSLSESGT